VEYCDIDVTPSFNPDSSEWDVFISGRDAWHMAQLAKGTPANDIDDLIGEMSYDVYSTMEEAEEAAVKKIDKVFITGNLDLRNALDNYGMKVY
jgi:hypothetical protein